MIEHRALRPEDVAGQDGLTVIRRLIAGELPAPPMARTLDFELVEAEQGRAVFRGTPHSNFYNPLGTIHGGWAATLLDSALGCAVHTTLAPGEGYTTVEFKVNLVRAITEDTGEVICEGRVIHRGKRIAVSEATLKTAYGALLATGSETCMMFPAPAAT